MRFGERLKELREAVGLSQSGLANKSGINLSSIKNWEQHRRTPDWRALLDIAKALGVDPMAFDDCVADNEEPVKKRTKKKE